MLLEAGDIVWAEFDPALGTEQAGRRPALVVTRAIYHEGCGRALVCPISRTQREWPFEVSLREGMKTAGVVLVDQVRIVDRAARIFGIVEAAPAEVLAEVRGKLAALIGIDTRHETQPSNPARP